MGYKYKLFWTDEALRNLDQILKYLEQNWTQKEVDHFKNRLSSQLDIILRFPFIFPKSDKQPRLRKSVLSKQTTIFYEIKRSVIYVVYLFDNRQDPNKLK
jgi:plasmid stabilization system protein ParE